MKAKDSYAYETLIIGLDNTAGCGILICVRSQGGQLHTPLKPEPLSCKTGQGREQQNIDKETLKLTHAYVPRQVQERKVANPRITTRTTNPNRKHPSDFSLPYSISIRCSLLPSQAHKEPRSFGSGVSFLPKKRETRQPRDGQTAFCSQIYHRELQGMGTQECWEWGGLTVGTKCDKIYTVYEVQLYTIHPVYRCCF